LKGVRKVKKVAIIFLVVVLSLAIAVPAFAADTPAKGGRDNAPTSGVVYVTNQGLYYDTFVPVSTLSWNGHNQNSFQLLEPGAGPGGVSQTSYGPGDAGYRGGRWWIDANGNGYQDSEGIDHYVLCPLLGPGRASP